MTVETNDTIERYTISGTGPYVFSFRIFDEDNLLVQVDGGDEDTVELAISTHYTVTGVDDEDGGSVTLTATAAALYAGDTIDIRSNTTEYQPTSIRNQGAFLPEVHENAFDRLARQIQDLSRKVNASVRYPDDETTAGAAPKVNSRKGRYLFANTVTGLFEWVTSIATTALDQTIFNQYLTDGLQFLASLLNKRTATEIASSSTPTDYLYKAEPEDVHRWGAVDTGGVTDSTTEIQDAFDALNAGSIRGGGVVFPGDSNSIYNISASIAVPARASGDNHTRWYSVRGMGRGGPRITAKTGLEDDPIISAAGQDASTYSFYREFRDLYLNGAGIANRGIELYYNQHFSVDYVFVTSLDDGASAGSAAGVRVFGAISAQFIGLKVHNGDGYGIFAHGGSGNFFNANLIAGCSFLDLAADGNYFSGGASGNAWIGNTFEDCEHGLRFAGYAGSVGWCGGNYFELNKEAEVYLGEETAHDNFRFVANYLNGYTAGTSNTDYSPVKMKFAAGCQIVGNLVAQAVKSTTGYYILDANIAGGSVTDCVVAYNRVRGLATSTAPNTIYNLHGNWVNNHNAVIDPQFVPLIQANMIKGRWPYGGWTLSVTGTGVAVRSGSDIFGAPALLLTRPAASTAEASQTFTIQAQYKNRFVTLAVPITALATNEQIDITVTPNGTSPQATTISESTLANGDTKMVYVLVFVPSDATTIGVTISCFSTDASFIVGHPCLYVGAQPWHSSSGDQFWQANAAPTTGTWVLGNIVFDSVPVSGAQMGWMCTVAGAPGTWVSLPNLA